MNEIERDMIVDVQKVMDANKAREAQEAAERHSREDDELLRVFHESPRFKEDRSVVENNDVMVKAVNKARRINNNGLNINIRGAEQASRVRVNVDDGSKDELRFVNVCSGLTLVLALAIFAMKIMEVFVR